MDDADLTTEREEKMMELLRRRAPREEVQPTGSCLYCEEPVELPKKFCCLECSQDWDYVNKRRNNRG